jgi:hypothetical protein
MQTACTAILALFVKRGSIQAWIYLPHRQPQKDLHAKSGVACKLHANCMQLYYGITVSCMQLICLL